MSKKTFMVVTIISVFLISLIAVVQGVKAQSSVTVYINSDGNVDPSTAPIQRSGNVYILKADLSGSIIVDKDNIVLDGTNHALQKGTGAFQAKYGIDITDRINVTVENLKISGLYYSICMVNSSNIKIRNTIIEHTIGYGIEIRNCSNSEIIGNIINSTFRPIDIAPGQLGVVVFGETSVNNTISNNTITGEFVGIAGSYGPNNSTISWNNVSICQLGIFVVSYCNIFGNNVYDTVKYNSGREGSIGIYAGSHNRIYGNNFSNNSIGLKLNKDPYVNPPWGNGTGLELGLDNVIYGNNFVNNSEQVDAGSTLPNVWDKGTIGNYWSDYQTKYPNAKEIGSSGIGNTTYVIDSSNIDHYPLTKLVAIPEFPSWIILPAFLVGSLLIGVTFKRKNDSKS